MCLLMGVCHHMNELRRAGPCFSEKKPQDLDKKT